MSIPTVRIEVANGQVIGATCDSEVYLQIVDHDILDAGSHMFDGNQEVRVMFMEPGLIERESFHSALVEIPS